MPHLFTNRPRQYNLMSDYPPGYKHFDWESVNAVVYLVGGIAFIIGSIFFFPELESLADVGAWIFFAGSILYLIVTGHDLLESISYFRSFQKLTIWNRLEFFAALTYVAGTILFLAGSVFFLSAIGLVTLGAWCFIVGSFLFLIGACINVLQILQSGTALMLQLKNSTAITFIVGSTLFLVASIPYLWQISDASDRMELFDYIAWQYIFGSILFFSGGALNFYRAYRAMLHYRNEAAQDHDLHLSKS